MKTKEWKVFQTMLLWRPVHFKTESVNSTKISEVLGPTPFLLPWFRHTLGVKNSYLKMGNCRVERPDDTLTKWSKLAAPIGMKGPQAPPDVTFWEDQNIIHLNSNLITRETKPKLRDILSNTWPVFLKSVNKSWKIKKRKKKKSWGSV